MFGMASALAPKAAYAEETYQTLQKKDPFSGNKYIVEELELFYGMQLELQNVAPSI
jgi:hypothetical protein